MDVLRGILGIAVVLGLAAALSTARRRIPYRLVAWGIGVQVLLGLAFFKTEIGARAIEGITGVFTRILEFSYAGSSLVFGPIGSKEPPGGANYLAFQALPILIYFAGLMAILYHAGVMQIIIAAIARVLGRTFRVSGAESMAVAANIFVGMTEAPLVVRPYLTRMTRSELMTLMCGGFATVAGTVLGVYLSFVGEDYGPNLVAASVMSAPAAILIAKILVPETGTPETLDRPKIEFEARGHNLLDAIARGVKEGLFLALNVAAMLLVFNALIALVNWPLQSAGTSLESLFGAVLRPLAWILGAEWGDESARLGTLLGLKICANEWIAFQSLQGMLATGDIAPRTAHLASFALCGFANFGSIGVTLGGLRQLMPERSQELSELAFRAMLGGALASFLTAAVAGMLV